MLEKMDMRQKKKRSSDWDKVIMKKENVREKRSVGEWEKGVKEVGRKWGWGSEKGKFVSHWLPGLQVNMTSFTTSVFPVAHKSLTNKPVILIGEIDCIIDASTAMTF